MDFIGSIARVERDFNTNTPLITLRLENGAINELNDCLDKQLDVTLKKHREKRSLDANRLLWECIGKIATVLRTDKWQVYLTLIKRYGKYTYICVKPNAVEAVKSQWRECEEIGHVNINGTDSVQLLCYFGSHTYDSKEFSVLLDGTIYEMKQLGISTPAQEDLERSLELWKKQKNGD